MACVASVAVAAPQQARIDSGNIFNFGLLNNELNREKQEETTTPIPILRYVDTQNPDGSYTYGYESGDGTYKIETRYPTGEVKGKYGYIDPTGLFREVEYGAEPEKGFTSSGSGLEFVAPARTQQRPDTSLPQEILPTPAPKQQPAKQLVERARSSRRRDPAKDFITNKGRKVTVVKRRRPVAQPTPQPIIRPRSEPVQIPAQATALVTTPVQQVFQQPIFQQPQQPVFQAQQQRFVPQQFQQLQQPIQPVSLAAAFSAHPFINQFNPSSGVFSYNY